MVFRTPRTFVDPGAMVVGSDGTLYYADLYGGARLRALLPNGTITTIAGNQSGGATIPVNGTPALLASFGVNPGLADLAIAPDGTLYMLVRSYYDKNQIFSLAPGGNLLHTVAGGGSLTAYNASLGAPAQQVTLNAMNFSLAPDLSIYTSEPLLEFENATSVDMRHIQPVAFPGLGPSQFQIPSQDGREVYTFDENGRHLNTLDGLTGATRFVFGYDSNNRLSTIADAVGNVTTIQHNGNGLPTAIVSPYGQTTTLGTDVNGYLSSISNPNGETVAMTYSGNQAGIMTSFQDAAGNLASFSYDGEGRLTQTSNAAGGALTFSPTDTPVATQLATSMLHTVAETSALGVTSSYAIQTTQTAENRTATLPSGIVATQVTGVNGTSTTTLASGTKTTITVGQDPRFGLAAPFASTLTSVSPAGLTFTQDSTETAALSNPANLLTLTSLTVQTTTDPVNNLSYSDVYTASSRLWQLTTAAGRSRTVTLDTLGRLASSQRDSLNADLFAYDSHGRLATLAQGTRTRTFAYDTNGMLSKVTDPALDVTSYTRDGAGRVLGETLADGSAMSFTYDADGRLASMTPPTDNTHLFTHSPIGLLASYVAPSVPGVSSTTTAYTYDADGRLTLLARPDGATAAIGYDTAGRTSTVSIPTGELTVAYDPKTGRPAIATGPSSEQVSYVYDGNLTTQMVWSGTVPGQVAWTYDKSMKPVSELVNGTGISFAYDADGLMTKAGVMTLVPSATSGLLTGSTIGNVTDAITYDNYAERATYAAKYLTTALFSTSYTRDALGRIVTKSETVQGTTHSYTYTYDTRGRLTQVTKDGVATTYAYDANGNRLSTTTGSTTTTATYDAQDRLLTYGTVTYTYDANGDLATRTDSANGGVTSYLYDALGNLIGVVLPGGDIVGYVVDAAGRRVAKTLNGQIQQEWLYRDSLRPVAELDSAGAVTSRFVYSDNRIADKSVLESIDERLGLSRATPLLAENVARPMYIVQTAQTLRVVADHLGSARMLVNVATGAVVETLDYDAFGNVITATGTGIPALAYAGGIFDPDTNLVHFGARDYDPQTGRWTSKEPMKTSGTANFYQYAGGDPINSFDVNGLAQSSCPDAKIVLDSICGPNAEGEVVCLQKPSEATGESSVAQSGSTVVIGSDTTTQPTPSTNLPSVPVNGDGQTSDGWVDIGASSSPLNQTPVVSVGSSNTLSVTFPANNIPLNGTVTDSGPFTPTILWSWTSGPAAPVFANPASAATTVSFPAVGVYVLTLTAACLELEASATLTVTVLGPPTVQVSGPTTVDLYDAENNPPVYAGQVIEPLPGRTATATWSMVSGPGTVTFGTPTGSVPYGTTGILTTTATFSASGNYVLALTATDGTYASSASIPVTINGDEAPVVSVSGNQTLPQPTTTNVAGAAVGYLPNLPLSYTWSEVSGPAAATFSAANQPTTNVTLPYPGVYVIQLSVSDTELTTTASLTITVNGTAQQPPQGPTGPAPSTPVIGGIVDDGVVTQPVQITGTFANALWTLQYRLGGRDDVTTEFTTLASGTGAMNNGVLGTFDPTLLLNGMYTVQLIVSTSGGVATASVAVAVDGRMKVGNFTLAFTDLNVAVGGLPLQLIRTYDSRVKTVGDFGFGWNLSIENVRIEKAGETGAYWQVEDDTPDDSFFPYYCLQPSQSASVTVTFPSGREYRFTPSPTCSWLEPPDPEDIYWTCTSDPDNPTIQLYAYGAQSLLVSGGQLVNLSDFSVWNPTTFAFTNELGQKFQITQSVGVTQETDRNKNTLSITPEGIFSSLGPSVPFVRDALGRITTITDPTGKPMTYQYDVNGDLVTYTDRASNVTTITYQGNHYLNQITNALGEMPIRCDYDDSGRLIDEIDAAGHEQTFTTTLALNQQQIADRLGRVTTYTYDRTETSRQKIDPTGAIWNYTIDPNGNVLTSVNPLGNTTTSTYDGANNLLTRTDPLGLTTAYTYDSWRQNLTTVDPLGHTTTNVYDPNSGNLLTTTDALKNVTTYSYDANGNRLSMTDPLGNLTAYAYNAAGRHDEPDRPARQRHELHLQLERLEALDDADADRQLGHGHPPHLVRLRPGRHAPLDDLPRRHRAFEHVHRDGEARDERATSSGGRRATPTTSSIVSSRPRAPTAPPSRRPTTPRTSGPARPTPPDSPRATSTTATAGSR